MNESPPSDRAMRKFIKSASPIMAQYVIEHNSGLHMQYRVTGCPGCLLAPQTSLIR